MRMFVLFFFFFFSPYFHADLFLRGLWFSKYFVQSFIHVWTEDGPVFIIAWKFRSFHTKDQQTEYFQSCIYIYTNYFLLLYRSSNDNFCDER